MLISVFMMLPLLIFGSWLYFRFTPRATDRTSRGFDVVVFGVAIAGSLLLSWLSLRHAPADAGPIWPPVLMTLAVYHVFAIVLPVGAWIKRRRFKP